MTTQERLVHLVGTLIGQTIAYKVYRRLGAPRWAALGFADLAGRVAHVAIQLKEQHDQAEE